MSSSGKILLVDDEAHIRLFVSLLLRKQHSPSIVEAGDGLQALALYEIHRPDLVLLDVNMPHLDGLHTLERLMQRWPEANVVMLTSLTNRQTVEDCLRLGALDYIRKDLPKDELGAHLQQIVTECFAAAANPTAGPTAP